jgi:hypothetical protein
MLTVDCELSMLLNESVENGNLCNDRYICPCCEANRRISLRFIQGTIRIAQIR